MKKNITIKELASQIGKALEKEGVEAVLVGGGCVSIYSNNKYQSYDLDYITYENEKKAVSALNKLGFFYDSRKYYVHPNCLYLVEFLAPPIAIGEELVTDHTTIKYKSGTINLLTPTDCVKDRLASFFHWNDKQSLEQAVLVAKSQKVDIQNIKNWTEKEGQVERLDEFLSLL